MIPPQQQPPIHWQLSNDPTQLWTYRVPDEFVRLTRAAAMAGVPQWQAESAAVIIANLRHVAMAEAWDRMAYHYEDLVEPKHVAGWWLRGGELQPVSVDRLERFIGRLWGWPKEETP